MGNLIESICQRCIGETNTSTRINELCEEHYFEWVEIKGFNVLSMDEEYFHLV
jgi:hypothetical protein